MIKGTKQEGLIIQQHRDFIKYRSQDKKKKKNTEPNAITGAQKTILFKKKSITFCISFFFFLLYVTFSH